MASLCKRYLILDRDAKYSDAFCGVLAREGFESSDCRKLTEFERVRERLFALSRKNV